MSSLLFIVFGPPLGSGICKVGFTPAFQTRGTALAKESPALMPGMHLPLILKRCLVGPVMDMPIFLWLMSSSRLTRWIGAFWIVPLAAWGLRTGLGRSISLTTLELGFALSSRQGWREAWTRDGGILQGCPLSMVYRRTLCHVPWCRYLAGLDGVVPQLYADNLKCTTRDDSCLLAAARLTDRYIRAVGQEASPGKCVLLSTSKATRKRMKDWSISYGDKGSAVKLDVTWAVIWTSLIVLGPTLYPAGLTKLFLECIW